MSKEFLDVVGLPTYFVDTAIAEDVGNGMIRVTNCQTRNGVLVPQFDVIISAARLILAGRTVADCAQDSFNREMMGAGARH